MIRKITAMILATALILAAGSAALASETGLFGILAAEEGADERLAALEEAAERFSVSISAGSSSVEIRQAYYEGNRVYIAYLVSGKGIEIQDGLEAGDGFYADIFYGEEAEQADGTVIGWKECIVPDEAAADTQTFYLLISGSEGSRAGITLNRHGTDRRLQGESQAASCRARAEIEAGKIDMTGTVRLASAEQAASWLAWQEGEEDNGADVIVCWNLYRDGELISYDLSGACEVVGSEEVVFDVMFPRVEDLNGLRLVPEYSENGENPDEAILLEPADGE